MFFSVMRKCESLVENVLWMKPKNEEVVARIGNDCCDFVVRKFTWMLLL